ncbi:Uncharacterized protein GBIM_01276, partial [Gryllus bimaculatus]
MWRVETSLKRLARASWQSLSRLTGAEARPGAEDVRRLAQTFKPMNSRVTKTASPAQASPLAPSPPPATPPTRPSARAPRHAPSAPPASRHAHPRHAPLTTRPFATRPSPTRPRPRPIPPLAPLACSAFLPSRPLSWERRGRLVCAAGASVQPSQPRRPGSEAARRQDARRSGGGGGGGPCALRASSGVREAATSEAAAAAAAGTALPKDLAEMDLVGLVCCLAAGLLYHNTLDAGFVYDDRGIRSQCGTDTIIQP